MITSVEISNLGPLRDLNWRPGGGFNLAIGVNDSGKTLLLKAVYALVRAREEYRRGDDPRTFRQVLDDKLVWTFQLPRLGEIVTRGSRGPCSVGLTLDGEDCHFRLTTHAEKGVGHAEGPESGRGAMSIFIPAKEVMSTFAVIKESRDQQKFGFDDPTYDLVRALEAEPSRGKPPFGEARAKLERLVGGRLIQRPKGGWVFNTGRVDYPVSITAEGIKKIAIIDRLIVNRTLSTGSIVFIDEPESFLHPQAVTTILDILGELVDQGVQIFLATHSYFVLKKLLIMARRKGEDIPMLSLPAKDQGQPVIGNLREEMPDNPIVDVSIALYEEELDAELSAESGLHGIRA